RAFKKGLPVFGILLPPEFQEWNGRVLRVRDRGIHCRQAGQRKRFAAFRGFRFQASNRRTVAYPVANVPNEAAERRKKSQKQDSCPSVPHPFTIRCLASSRWGSGGIHGATNGTGFPSARLTRICLKDAASIHKSLIGRQPASIAL